MTECVEGIYLSHALNIVHLDIKAENIFLDRFEHGKKVGHAKIGDFGIANQVENRYTTTDKGSVHFVPPEVWMGDHFNLSPIVSLWESSFIRCSLGKCPLIVLIWMKFLDKLLRTTGITLRLASYRMTIS